MNQYTIAFALSAFVVLNLCISLIIRYSRLQHKVQACAAAIQNCAALERRKVIRSVHQVHARIRQPVVADDPLDIEFSVRDISSGGLYLYTDRSTPFDPGEVIDLTVDYDNYRYYSGKAQVVHSEAVYNDESIVTETGIGVKFLRNPNESPHYYT